MKNKHLKKLVVEIVISFLGIMLIHPHTALACTCSDVPFFTEALTTDTIFLGTVNKVDLFNSEVYLNIQKVWKGKIAPTIKIPLWGAGKFCSYSFNNDETYIVYASKEYDNTLSVSDCSRTAPIQQAQDDITKLNLLNSTFLLSPFTAKIFSSLETVLDFIRYTWFIQIVIPLLLGPYFHRRFIALWNFILLFSMTILFTFLINIDLQNIFFHPVNLQDLFQPTKVLKVFVPLIIYSALITALSFFTSTICNKFSKIIPVQIMFHQQKKLNKFLLLILTHAFLSLPVLFIYLRSGIFKPYFSPMRYGTLFLFSCIAFSCAWRIYKKGKKNFQTEYILKKMDYLFLLPSLTVLLIVGIIGTLGLYLTSF